MTFSPTSCPSDRQVRGARWAVYHPTLMKRHSRITRHFPTRCVLARSRKSCCKSLPCRHSSAAAPAIKGRVRVVGLPLRQKKWHAKVHGRRNQPFALDGGNRDRPLTKNSNILSICHTNAGPGRGRGGNHYRTYGSHVPDQHSADSVFSAALVRPIDGSFAGVRQPPYKESI